MPDNPHVSMLGRATTILRSFGPHEFVLPLAELTRRSGLTKPTVYRLATELAGLGLLERVPGGYRLGIQLVEISQRSWWQRVLRDTALPFLEYLSEATGHTANLGVLDGSDVVYLEKLPGANDDVRISRPGARLPAHCTGLGKALLAFAPGTALRAALASGLTRHGPRTITSPRRFVHEIDRVRDRRVAYDAEESAPGMFCVAVPILAGDATPRASLSISGCTTAAELDRLRPVVQTATREITRRLEKTPTRA